MFGFILFLFSSVALNSAQLNTGPQTFSESLFASENNDKQIVNKRYSFYVAPLQLNSRNENNIRNSETANQDKQQFGQQDFGKQQSPLSSFINFSPIEESQGQNREQVSENTFNQKEESFNRQLQDGLKLINSYTEQKPREEDKFINFQQGSQLQKELLKSIPKTLFADKNQEQRSFGEDLQQKWSSILGNNLVNLKSLSTFSDEQFLNAQPERPEQESDNKEEQKNTETGNVIEYILRNHGDNEFSKQNVYGTEELSSQNTPFIIQQQRSSISDNNREQLKGLSAFSEDNQFLNFAQTEQTNLKEEGQQNSEVRKQIEDIIKNRVNIAFVKQNAFGTKQLNDQVLPVFNQQQRYRNLDNNRDVKADSNNKREEQGDAEVRKLIEDIVRNRNNNNFGKQNGFRTEQPNYQGLSLFNGQQSRQQRPINNRVHLKALSTIPEDNQFLKAYAGFGNRS